MSECVYNTLLSEISLETKVSGSDPDACGGIAREIHQVSQLSSVNKRVSIYKDVTVRFCLRLRSSGTALRNIEPKRDTSSSSTSYKDKFVMYPCLKNFCE
jgi:hypothetical protein